MAQVDAYMPLTAQDESFQYSHQLSHPKTAGELGNCTIP